MQQCLEEICKKRGGGALENQVLLARFGARQVRGCSFGKFISILIYIYILYKKKKSYEYKNININIMQDFIMKVSMLMSIKNLIWG